MIRRRIARSRTCQNHAQMYVPKGVPKRVKNHTRNQKSPVKPTTCSQRIGQKRVKNGLQKRNQKSTERDLAKKSTERPENPENGQQFPKTDEELTKIPQTGPKHPPQFWSLLQFSSTSSICRTKLRGNRGSLRSHWGNLRKCIRFADVGD
jgi:hypothetical protein